jgi:Asp-tRNA(Asn)/Glu-tRNA(Gln) amidotransferase B subunit
MKATRGSANPQVANAILIEELKAHCASRST